MHCTIYPIRPGVKWLRSISAYFSGLFLLAAAAGAQSPLPAEPETPEHAALAVPAPAPATPVVTLESASIAATEPGADPRVVAGPPTDASAQRIYTGRFQYLGEAPAHGLRIVLEMPAGMRYVNGSATGPGAQLSYSVDGGLSFAPGAELPAPEDCTHLRWDLPGRYAPGTRGLVSFRAVPRTDGIGSEDDTAPETT